MAIKDATGSTQLGGLNTLIGVDVGRYHDSVPHGFVLDTVLVVTRIGGATAPLEDANFPGKSIQLKQTSGSVANGGVIATGWLNRTGATIPAGKYVFAVAA